MIRILGKVVKSTRTIKNSLEVQRWMKLTKLFLWFLLYLPTRSSLCGLWTCEISLEFHLLPLFLICLFHYRCLSTQTQTKSSSDEKTRNVPKTQQDNHSFVHNLFRGQVEHSQVFPFPIALNQEQIEYVGDFVDPLTKFFLEVNDAQRNDLNAVSFK